MRRVSTASFPAAIGHLALVLLLAAGCRDTAAPRDEERPRLPTADEVREELSPLAFDAFVERSFRILLRRSPESVVELGLERELDVGRTFLDDVSDAFAAETRAQQGVVLELLKGHDRAALSRTQQVTYDVYAWWLEERQRDARFEAHDYRINPTLASVNGGMELFFTDVHPLRDVADVESYVGRLGRVAEKLGQVEETLRRQEAAGVRLPQPLLRIVRPQLQSLSTMSPRSTPFYASLLERGTFLSGPDRERLLGRAEEVVRASVQPAYASLARLLAAQEPLAPTALGVWQLPDGEAYYAHTLRRHVTADVTAEELHQLGLRELESLHQEMRARFTALGFPAGETIAQGLARAAQAGGTVPASQVVSTYTLIIEQAQARLGEAFDLVPSAAVVVVGGEAGGFYVPPSLDGSRPGAFFATATRPEARFGMRTLAYHEAVPGHHLQLGVAQDLALPLVRRVVGFTGSTEGWALYAERLASELGWYQDDALGDVGRLQAEAFRAARLVVDTGIHARRWTQAQAVQFMQDNVGFSPGAANGQVIRYAAWPGQATAYMTGALRLRALRERVRTTKGESFDLKAFHRAVLSHGSLPLELLERVVAADLGLP